MSPALAGGKSQIFCQSRNEDIMMDRKIFHKLLYYLPPSECTGNRIIYSIVCIRYLVPFQELLNQEHRGINRHLDISKFEISFINTQALEKLLVYHTVGRSSEGKTSWNSRCQTRSLTCPSDKVFSSVKKNRAPKRQQGKMQRYPKVDPYFRGK